MTTGATMRGMAIDQADDPAAGRLTVVLADDASAMRALVRRLLEDSGSFDVVGEAADGEEAVRLAASLHPDLVLLDVAMPGTSGLAAIPALVGASPASRIVVLSALDAGRVRNDVLAAGADEFMEKRLVSDSLAQRLVEACRRPRAGHLHDVPVPVAGPVAGPAAPVPVPVAEPVPVPGPGPVAVPGPVPVPFAGPADEPLPAVGPGTGPVPAAGARPADGPLPAVGPVSRPGLRADSSSEGPSRSGPEPRSEVGPAPGPGARSPDGPGEDGVVRRTDWFRLAFDHSPIGMALVDVHGRFGSVNRALCEILGRRPADLIGAGVHHVSHPGDLARHGELRQQLLRSQASGTESRYEADWRFVRADGELAWTSVTCSLLPAGGGSPAGFLWQVVDLTARRAAESARVLTEELRERHENELTRAHTDLVQFATVAAHDLKSPLQVISGFAGLLEQTHGDDLDERGREFLAFILKSTGRMHALIDDLLAYAKVGADRRAPVAVPLDRVVDEVRATLHNEIAGSGASITCDPLPVVAGDPTQLAHLLGDLVANALKFVAPGVSPRIRISASRMINAWCIEVADNGVGIDPQHRSYVFGMFQRLRRQEYEGTGIGLAICARIVEQRGGAIWVEDNPAGGSRFRFTVPDEPVPPRADDGWEPGDGRVGDGATLDDPGDGRAGDGREPDDGRAGDFATLDDPGDGRAADDPGDNGPLAGGPPAGGPEAGGPPAGSSDPGAPEAGGSDPGGTEAQASQSPALAPPAWG
ncbi:MAG: hypothetical protein QOI99_1765, partial [Actinomycetota bacterium]|nr:hypothetical protein [Actinomycetota bacterium]